MGLIDGFVETDLKFGDWVAYESDGRTRVGRVTHPTLHGTAEVIFSTSCTATKDIPVSKLRIATQDEINKAPNGIGYNRFKGRCIDRNEDECWFCTAVYPD